MLVGWLCVCVCVCVCVVRSFTAQVIDNPWANEELPAGAVIPEKPLVQEKKKCVIQ